MWGFWKGGVGLSGSREVGFTVGLAKFSFRALRLPGGTKRETDPDPPMTCTPHWAPPAGAKRRHAQGDKTLVVP